MRSERELGEKFEFQTCLLLKSSELIRTPLVYRYDFLIRRHCNQAGNYNPTVEMTDGLLRCLNNDYPEARDITLALIALNQSTCRSIMTSKAILIQNLLDSLDQSDGQSAFSGRNRDAGSGMQSFPACRSLAVIHFEQVGIGRDLWHSVSMTGREGGCSPGGGQGMCLDNAD